MESPRAARRGKGSAKEPSASVRPSAIFRQANQRVRPQNSRWRLWIGGPSPRSPAKMMRPTSRLSRCPAGSCGTPRKQPGGETPPGSAQPPELLEDPLYRDRERTVDDLRLTDLEVVDAAQAGTEKRVPLRLVTNSG